MTVETRHDFLPEEPGDHADYIKAMLNIIGDFSEEKQRLQDIQRAVVNILEDADKEKERLQDAQRAVVNILDDSDAEGQEYLHRIRAATQRMAQLIDDLLNLSRITRMKMHTTTANLSALAHAIAAELQSSQPERSVEVHIQDGLTALGDERLLHVVLVNLLQNAWKFTNRHPHARIEFGSMLYNRNSVAFYVRDDGAGFDMQYAGHLFGAFQRLHSGHEFPGIGVGLATVQRIIHRHGGMVWAEGAVEQGATFYFTLPVV